MPYSETDRAYDELLVVLVLEGDGRAADRLAQRWQPRLLRTARRLLRDEDLAQEAVQESWAGICRGWARLSQPEKFPAWAFGILHRKCADRIKILQKSRTLYVEYEDQPTDGRKVHRMQRTGWR